MDRALPSCVPGKSAQMKEIATRNIFLGEPLRSAFPTLLPIKLSSCLGQGLWVHSRRGHPGGGSLRGVPSGPPASRVSIPSPLLLGLAGTAPWAPGPSFNFTALGLEKH